MLKQSDSMDIKLKQFFLIVTCLITIWGSPGVAKFGSQDAGVTGREIFRQAVKCAGGAEAFQRLENITIKTQSQIFSGQKKIELTVTETIDLPNRTKQVMQLAAGKRIQVLNGSNSWKQLNDEMSALSALEKREMERGLFRDLVNLFQGVGRDEVTVTYLNDSNMAGEALHVLQIKNKKGDFFHLYIDASTYFVKKKTYHGAAETDLASFAEVYSNYKEVGGIQLPHKTIVMVNGRKFMESLVVDVQINSELGKEFFLRSTDRR